jgi:hypothetical protein
VQASSLPLASSLRGKLEACATLQKKAGGIAAARLKFSRDFGLEFLSQ